MGLEHFLLQLMKTRRGRAVLALMLTAAGTFFSLLMFPQVESMRALERNHGTTVAYVIDARISSDMHGFSKNYDLRYRFRLNGRGPWYYQTERGPLARKELWETLPKAEWEAATRRGRIDVIYLSSDPSVNALARNGSRLTGDVYMGVGFSLFFLLPGLAWLCCIAWSIGARLVNPELRPISEAVRA